MAKTRDETPKSYLMELENGKVRRITIPTYYRVTIGIAQHSGQSSIYTYPVRIYAGTSVRAIFTDAVSFREEEMNVEIAECKF